MLGLVLAILSLAQVATAQVFLACITSLPTVSIPIDGTSTASSTLDCATRCGGNTYSFFNPTTTLCYCSTVSPAPNTLVTGAPSVCNTNQYISSILQTTFTFSGCYTDLAFNSDASYSISGVVGGYSTCFQQCKNYRIAVLKSGGTSSYDCFCSMMPLSSSTTSSTCGSGTYYLYDHPAGAAASGLARRAVKDKKRRQQQMALEHRYCPPGYQVCQVDDTGNNGYECINTSTELESCGSCRFGFHNQPTNATGYAGIDCTSLHGVRPNSVSCIKGECHIRRCRPGYKLFKGKCV